MKGKEKCKALKEIRRQIAEQNDIADVVEECKHKGECKGTCPKCEADVRYLERELAKKRAMGQKIALAGISMGVAASFSACTKADAIDVISFPAEVISNTVSNIFHNEPDYAGDVEPLGGEATIDPNYVDPDVDVMGDMVEVDPDYDLGGEEDVEYDEDGNPITKEEYEALQAQAEDDVEYVDEDGNPITKEEYEALQAQAEGEVEYVDEEGNPISKEEYEASQEEIVEETEEEPKESSENA